jgi:hypothetical protein
VGGINMETVIVRNKEITGIESNLILLNGNNQFKTREELIDRYGIDEIMKKVFREDVSFEFLKEKYDEFKNGTINGYFFTVTKLDSEYGVMVTKDTSHIYLVHLEPLVFIGNNPLVYWYYFNSKKYIGDAWWSNDEEIAKDVEEIPLISFLRKYKGF